VVNKSKHKRTKLNKKEGEKEGKIITGIPHISQILDKNKMVMAIFW
jgi:hypothetical protein